MMFGGGPTYPQPQLGRNTWGQHGFSDDYFNEVVPFRCSLNGFGAGTRVRVVGLPFHHGSGHHHHHHERRFEVNLVGQDGEKFIHVNPRKHENTIVINNTRSGQCWQMEERTNSMPLNHDDIFTLDLIAENDATRIVLNGVHISEFFHRSDPQWVRHVEVAGDLKLHCVSISRR